MKAAARIVVLACMVLAATASPADARRSGGVVVINTGDDIEYLEDAPDMRLLEEGFSGETPTKIGYRYSRFGLFWADLWRWDGEFVLYGELGGHTTYYAISDDMAEQMGVSVPWSYRFPPGFLLVLAGLELLVMIKLRPRVKTTYIVGGSLMAVTVFFLAVGLVPHLMIPGLLGLYHLVSAWTTSRSTDEETIETATVESPPERRMQRPSMPPPPRVGDDPFRNPPAPAPLQVQLEAPVRPSATPIVHDASVEGPKFLT